ncbi:MAG: gliding motility-associated ABC transporter permease subunit GldF [Mesonia hippocampi]|uniref:gliding motility-associated ABC transporter permease subunit GldF n=1 Tax=Mesonia hippocampi TaxID=1628250 RepID=UPI003F9D1AFC
MRAILYKEINTFFSSAVGYVVIAIFLLLNALFLWFLDSGYNIFDQGYASLLPFFNLAPWVFIFLIPAICMKSFSEEKKQGTLELLQTLPISTWQLVLGKFFGALLLSVLALLPTLIYVACIYYLGKTPGNFDTGEILGSYIGLFFLASIYTAMGIFASSLTNSQIIAFMTGAFLCFISYFGFSGLTDAILNSDIYALEYLGIAFHYKSISRGVIDTRDIVYFISVTALFLSLTQFNLNKKN